MSAPRVGVTPSRSKENPELHQVTANMLKAIELAGGEAVVLDYPMDEKTLPAVLDTLDGLILAGGPDVHPRYFGQEIDPNCGEICEDRDILELYLMKWAMERDVPVLGVCRGAQVINIALGGDIHQDLVHNQGLVHRQDASMRYFHDVVFEGDSMLRRMVPSKRYPVNSYHHQAVRRVADGLVVTACAPDGVVEAFERPASRFLMGVQWHPESSYAADHLSREIFRAFMDACKE